MSGGITKWVVILQVVVMALGANAQEKPEVFVQLGHSDGVFSIAFSSDGRFIVSGSRDKTIKILDAISGREIRTIEAHNYGVTTIDISSDNRYLASGGFDKTVKLWDINTGKEIKVFSGHNGFIFSVAFSPNLDYLASCSFDKTVKIWEIKTGRILKEINLNTNATSVVFSPNGKYLAAGTWEKTIMVWDVATWNLKKIFTGHKNFVRSVRFSPDGKYIASGSDDMTIKLWDISTGQEIKTLTGHTNNVVTVAFSPDGEYLASGSGGFERVNNDIKIWDISTGKEIRTISGHSDHVESIAFSPDGKYLVSGSLDKTIKLWEVNTGNLIRKLEGFNYDGLSIDIAPDERYIMVPSGKDIKIWDLLNGRLIKELKGHNDRVNEIKISKDGKFLVSGSTDKTVKIWDLMNGKELKTLIGHIGSVTSIAISPDGKLVASGGDFKDKTVRIWDVKSGRLLKETGKGCSVGFMSFSNDGKYILFGGNSFDVYLYDLTSNKIIKEFKGHSHFVNSAAFSPDGKFIASGGNDKIIMTRNVESGQLLSLFADKTEISSVVFSFQRNYIISGGYDNMIKFWDLKTGKKIKELKGHRDYISSLKCFNNDKYLISGSRDGTVRLWNVETGKEIAMFVSFTDGEWVTITPEGYYDASENGDKYLNVRIGNSVYGIENYRETFFRPDLVKLALSGQALKDFKTLADIKLPPQVEILNAPSSAQQEEIDITVKLTDQGGGIGDVRLYLNETAVLVDGARGMKKISQDKTQTRSYRIKLVGGANVIKAVAFNADNSMQSNAAMHTVVASLKLKKPSMYVLAIGINEFKNPKLELRYAVADAKLFVEALKESAKELFEKIEVRLLTTKEETTKESIKAALEGMRGISPEDVFVFYVASHGIAEEGEYFLLTSNVGSVSTNRLREDALTQAELKEMIANVRSTKKFIALDACNSGKLGEELQVAMLARTRGMSEETAIKILSRAVGSMILSASTTQQEALEGYEGHGLFTFVLAEGLRGKADKDNDGVIRTVELSDYVDLKVPEIAERVFKRAQYPTATPSGQAFPIGKAK
jgi:WD40 repeat protein